MGLSLNSICKLSFPVLALLLLAHYANSQNVIIKGIAPFVYKGKTVTAFTFKDFITNTPLEIGSSKINDSGKFKMEISSIKKCSYAYLNIDNLNFTIYLNPGGEYHVIVPLPDTTHYQNPYINHIADLTFLFRDTNDFNNLIIDFNEQFDQFWANDYMYFVRKQSPPYIDSFYAAMKLCYAKTNNEFFKTYVLYTIAGLELNVMEGKKTLASKFIKNKPVLYDNKQYMDFFTDFFDGYVEHLADTRDGAGIYNLFEQADYKGLLELLKRDPLLSTNDTLCELVFLKGLNDMYENGNYQVTIRTMLHNYILSSKIEPCRAIAIDMIESFSETATGNEVPGFALKDSKGVINSILDFRGKYLYLWFFKSNSNPCIREMEIIPELVKVYGKRVNFLAISEDDDFAAFSDFVSGNKSFTWTFLYDAGQQVLKKYDVKALPEYFLISPQGQFVYNPADSPSHGIQLKLDELIPPAKKRIQ